MARILDAIKANPSLQEEYDAELARVAKKYPNPDSPEFLSEMRAVEARLNPASSIAESAARDISTGGKKVLQSIDWGPGIGRASVLGGMELLSPSSERQAQSPEYQKDLKDMEEAISKQYGFSIEEMRKMPEYTSAVRVLQEEHKTAPYITKEEFARSLKGPLAEDFAPSMTEGLGRAYKEKIPFIGSVPSSAIFGVAADIGIDPSLLLPGGSLTSALRKTPTASRAAQTMKNTAAQNRAELEAVYEFAKQKGEAAEKRRLGKLDLSKENLAEIAKSARKFIADPVGSTIESVRRKMARNIYEAADRAAMETASLPAYEGTRASQPKGYKISDFILDEGIPVGNLEERISSLYNAREKELGEAYRILDNVGEAAQLYRKDWMNSGIKEAKRIAKKHNLPEVRKVAEKFLDDENLKILSGVKDTMTPLTAKQAVDRLHEIQATLAHRGLYTDSSSEQVDNAKNLILGTMAADLRKSIIERMDKAFPGAGGEWAKRNERFRRFNMAYENDLANFRKGSDKVPGGEMTQASASPAVIAAYGVGQKAMNAGIPAAYATTMAVNATKNKGFQSFLASRPRVMKTAFNVGRVAAIPAVNLAEKTAYSYPVGKEALQLSGWDYVPQEIAPEIQKKIRENK